MVVFTGPEHKRYSQAREVVSIQSQSLNRYAPNLCCICVDLICDGYYTGRFYHYYSARPIQFHSQHELIVNIDTLCDQLDYRHMVELQSESSRWKLG